MLITGPPTAADAPPPIAAGGALALLGSPRVCEVLGTIDCSTTEARAAADAVADIPFCGMPPPLGKDADAVFFPFFFDDGDLFFF